MRDKNNRIHFKRGLNKVLLTVEKKETFMIFSPEIIDHYIIKNRGHSWVCDHHLYQMSVVTQTFSYHL